MLRFDNSAMIRTYTYLCSIISLGNGDAVKLIRKFSIRNRLHVSEVLKCF